MQRAAAFSSFGFPGTCGCRQGVARLIRFGETVDHSPCHPLAVPAEGDRMFRFRPARLVGLAVLAFAVAALVTAAPAARLVAQEKKDEKKKVKSKLKVKVPQDDAKLFIEGKETKPSGEVREFETPEIEPGKVY